MLTEVQNVVGAVIEEKAKVNKNRTFLFFGDQKVS